MPSASVLLLNAATGIHRLGSGAFVVLAGIHDRGRRSSAAWRLTIGAFIYVVGKPFAGLTLEYPDILFFRSIDSLQCRVYYIVGMGKRVASALVLRRDISNIASHECLLVLCAQRGKPCLEAEAEEELGRELLPHLLFWSVGREYDGVAVVVVHRALRVGEMPALKQVEEEVPNRWVTRAETGRGGSS